MMVLTVSTNYIVHLAELHRSVFLQVFSFFLFLFVPFYSGVCLPHHLFGAGRFAVHVGSHTYTFHIRCMLSVRLTSLTNHAWTAVKFAYVYLILTTEGTCMYADVKIDGKRYVCTEQGLFVSRQIRSVTYLC